MKNNLRKMFSFVVFCLALGCAVAAFGQIRTGGYKSVPLTDAGVEEAANYAVETKAAALEQEILLEAILKAETQTVAGTNYRLCLEILVKGEAEDDGDIFFIKTVIHKSLKGEYKISSWEEIEDCAAK